MAGLDSTFLVEASWEVANKAGGIYTVLTTKLEHARNHFGEGRYLPVGPYTQPDNPDFAELEVPTEWKSIAATLVKKGVTLHYGTWQVPGKPIAILLGYDGLIAKSNEIKASLWDDFQLDTLDSDFNWVDQPLLWSVAVGHLVCAIASEREEQVILHAHEWLTSGAILTIIQQKAPVKTVFTTHATFLGRCLSNDGHFIYDKLKSFNPEEEAKRMRIVTKFQLEKLGAQKATVFTTVSTVTAKEATAFLGRKPMVVENGVDSAQFPTYDLIASRRPALRERLENMVSAYFFPSYSFNISSTRFVFTMGRYELKNKGYDLMLESLALLNSELKEKNSNETVVALLLVPGDSLRLRPDVSRKLTTYEHLARLLNTFSAGERRRIEREVWDDVDCSCTLLPENARDTARRLLDGVRSDKNPPLSPFDLRDAEKDGILTKAGELGLTNAKDDRVKIMFFPVYLDGFDGVFNLPLYDIVSACDLGVFPSLYEPWGYTPMESLILGVPAVTSNLAGFGQAVEDDTKGLIILNRDRSSIKKEAKALAAALQLPLQESERAWVTRRMSAYQTVEDFDWSKLYRKYLNCYDYALHG
jgi:glycogen synthase